MRGPTLEQEPEHQPAVKRNAVLVINSREEDHTRMGQVFGGESNWMVRGVRTPGEAAAGTDQASPEGHRGNQE